MRIFAWSKYSRAAAMRGWRLLIYPSSPSFGLTIALQFYFPQTQDLTEHWYLHLRNFAMFLNGFWLARAAALGLSAVYCVAIKLVPDPAPYASLVAIRLLRNLYLWLKTVAGRDACPSMSSEVRI